MHDAPTRVAAAPAPKTSLRERKRHETSARVQRAALRLCLANGSDHVTVDEICEASDVSARTFFNYFGSKEGALLGSAPSMPDAEFIDEHLHDGDTAFEALLTTLAHHFLAVEPDRELFLMRRELLGREPRLATLQMGRATEKREAFAEVAERFVAAYSPGLSEAQRREESYLLVGIVLGALHFAGRRWLEDPDAAPYDELIASAIERVRRLVLPA